MKGSIDENLERWRRAGIIDAITESRIRAFESGDQRQAGFRWQVLLALAFGAMLVAAGVALFVAAHWDRLSPVSRFLISLSLVALFHLFAIFFRTRFPSLATALHGIGTVAACAAIFLTGQIFNLRENWAGGVFLCFLCAALGWLLLRDQLQQLLTLLLLPSWLLSEWIFRTGLYETSSLFALRLAAIFAIVLMTVFIGSQRRLVANVLFIAGAIALFCSLLALAWVPWNSWREVLPLPRGWQAAGWLLIAAACAAGILVRRRIWIPAGAVLAVVIALPHCRRLIGHDASSFTEPSVVAWLLVAAFAILLAWLGVRESSRGLINVGILYFAATIVWFYFSDVMGKLDRSISLMLFGLLLFGGGWLLERMRRRLVAGLSATHQEAQP